jgi:restriction system protein
MPEELAIILVVAIGGIWLLVKILQGIGAAIDSALKSHDKAAALRKQNRYVKKRNALRNFVHVVIPDEIATFEKKFQQTHVEFDHTRNHTSWVVHRPEWIKEEFQALARPRKDIRHREMHADDIDLILTPNSESSTWSAIESKTIHRQCKYPSSAPAIKPEKLKPFPILDVNLQTAAFKTDAAQISDKEVGRYFSDEQSRVIKYNERRCDLTEKAAGLNSAIEEWNKENRAAWERYVAACTQVEDAEILTFRAASDAYVHACRNESGNFKNLLERYKTGEKQSVLERLDYVLDCMRLPASVPHTWDVDFDEEQKIAVIEIGLPDVVHQTPLKTVNLKSGPVKKLLNQTEKKELVPKIHPAVLLRTAYEVFRNDISETIALLVLNGWVKFDDPATGVKTKAYTASLMVERNQIIGLNLIKIDPLVAFANLHGKSAGKLVEIIPIEPMLSLNRKDSRFVTAKEVLAGLGTETNLAAMDWQDFEHLIRELFEKEFSGRGAEVKITQASRDRGVDAVVFDPDPIHGGKYVIQAKRYTHTVDVSSVRDLCAVVTKEGASRGILVTTSTYGADAYAFANNEPITLLNGAELLGLLKKHGYTFRINLQEARRSIPD